MPHVGVRKGEILDRAAELFATRGMRTTLTEIADACGILTGSLYHHFESRDALIIELVRRYQDELDEVAAAGLRRLDRPGPLTERVTALGEAIARCAVRHRAALLFTYYEPPSGAGEELVSLTARTPTAIRGAMLETLRSGETRPGIDLPLLADWICQSMLHIGIGVFHRTPGAEHVPAVKCRILLHGVAAGAPGADGSPAFEAAAARIASWDDGHENGRAALIHAAALAEFGRRGYDATTVRDIASAAGVSTSSVYHVIESKEHLLLSVLQSYMGTVSTGWQAILTAPATPAEKLDALIWFDVNVMNRFSDAFRMQFAGLRHAPPNTPDLDGTFPAHLDQVQSLLAEGARTASLTLPADPPGLNARCLFSLIWMPENIVRSAAPTGSLALARATVLRGATTL